MQTLKLFSAAIVEKLSSDIESNVGRYASGDFIDFAKQSGWSIETPVASLNESAIANLISDATPEAEVKNSLLVYNALPGMTPAMARDERIWARLCHVECLPYVRGRWLKAGTSLEARIRAHFFAPGLPGCRDDNAIGRLWWNTHIAKLASPHDVELGLTRLLSKANVRLQVIDRADTAFRQPLVAGIVRLLSDGWFQSYDAAVADFMFEVNKASGGMIFEALSAEQVDAHLATCLAAAKRRTKLSAAT